MKEKSLHIFVSGANIKKYRALRRLGQEELGDEIGVSRQTINTWEGKESVKLDSKMAGFLTQVLKVKINDLTEGATESDPELIPFYDAVAVGGYALQADQEPVNGHAEMINPGTFLRKASGSLRVYGHSMFPKYPAGCIVAFKGTDKDVIIWGEDYVIELEDRRIIKRVEKSEKEGYLKAVSYNKSEEYVYAATDIPVDKVKRLYMVLGKIELEASI